MNVYLDASAQVRSLTGDGPQLEGQDSWEVVFSSVIARVETRRTLDRIRLTGRVGDDWTATTHANLMAMELGISWLELAPEVLLRAGQSFGVVLSALDAIHVASAELIRRREVPDLVFATHDRQQAIGAMALGFEVIGVTL